MSQWHQFQVTKRNNISYQIYSTKDERLEKLTYFFFWFLHHKLNRRERTVLHRCCTDVVTRMLLGPLPPSDSRAEGERGPAGFWFCHDEICVIPPSCRFLIYPPFPIKACNPPKSSTNYTPPDRVITTIVTKYV